MHNVMIVDDEELARERIRQLLKPHEEHFMVIGEAASGLEAFEIARSKSPDAVFLDVQMTEMDGFGFLGKLGRPLPVVFTTAYDSYALRAFDENAVDYLLKPIQQARFDASLDRLTRALHDPMVMACRLSRLERLLGLAAFGQGPFLAGLKRLRVKVGDSMLLLSHDEILYFEAEAKYTNVITSRGKFVLDQSLVDLEKGLDSGAFLRIHRSILVNSRHVIEIRRKPPSRVFVVLDDSNQSQLPVSRGCAHLLMSL